MPFILTVRMKIVTMAITMSKVPIPKPRAHLSWTSFRFRAFGV